MPVVVRGEVSTPVAVHAVPRDAVHEVVARREVLDRDPVGFEDLYPIRALGSAIDDRPIAVDPADRQVRRRDGHGFLVDPGSDQDHPARLRMIDGSLDRVEILGDAHGAGVPGRYRFPAGPHPGTEQRRGGDRVVVVRADDRTGGEPDEGRRHGEHAVQQGSSPHRRGP